jgi:orotidine-5'-phosphate decarboxylase
VTPREAAAAGAKYVVVGRMVLGSADRRGAMDEVLEQLEQLA